VENVAVVTKKILTSVSLC